MSDALARLLELPAPELPTTFVTDENNDVTVRALLCMRLAVPHSQMLQDVIQLWMYACKYACKYVCMHDWMLIRCLLELSVALLRQFGCRDASELQTRWLRQGGYCALTRILQHCACCSTESC